LSTRPPAPTTVIGVSASFNEINQLVWAFLKARALLAQRLLCHDPQIQAKEGAESMDSLMIVGLLAAFVWIQMLTPPTSAEQKDNMAIRKARGEDDK
jgi:hypothetical protein